MIRIDLYAVLGETVVTVDHLSLDPDRPNDPRQKDNLAYHKSAVPIAHAEGDVVLEMIHGALMQAERAASERGGWSVLT